MHRRLLNRIGQVHSVQPRFIVALWGIETDNGRITSHFLVMNALAILAYGDSRYSTYSHYELLNALTIFNQAHITLEHMRGSRAGAVLWARNQCIPVNFLRFARDYTGDGRRDIWGTQNGKVIRTGARQFIYQIFATLP